MDAIIFLHTGHSDYLTARGYEDYLAHVLRQARRSNPGRRIVLLGDRADAATKAQVEFRDSKAYDAGAAEFRKLYAHLSPNTLAGERFCFERWFIVRDFCRESGIGSFLCADSDVVILADLAACRDRFEVFDVSLSEGTCAHAAYWSRLDVLDQHSCEAPVDGRFMRRCREFLDNDPSDRDAFRLAPHRERRDARFDAVASRVVTEQDAIGCVVEIPRARA